MKNMVCVAMICGLIVPSAAQENATDTSTVYRVPEVVITATRSPISLRDSPSPVDVITTQDIDRINALTLADVLRQSNGIFLNDQGGHGALKTLSLRGASSYHILVLVDGTRLNSFQNGLVDLSLLPVGNVERIEVVRGGSSALYGADALGGVVNVFTRRGTGDLRLRTEGSAGSFGFQKYLVEAEGTVEGVRLFGGFSDERGRDDYPFIVSGPIQGAGTLRRENADFHRAQAYLAGNMAPDEHSSITLTAQHVGADRGVPGQFFGPGFTSMARQRDEDANVAMNYLDSRLDGTELEIHTGFHYALQHYLDPNPSFPFDSYYRNRYFTIDPQLRFHLTSSERLIVGAEFAQGDLQDFGTPALRAFDRRIRRVQRSAYVSHESRFEFQRPVADRISFYQTARYDGISDVGHAITPKLGVNLRILREGDLRLRASVGQNFRAPTFNDLYYRGFSNPDLKSERSTSFDVGLTSEVGYYGRHALEVTYFHLDTENRILFDLVSFLPVNIGRALSRGVETKYTGTFLDELVRIEGAYTFNDARKKDRSSPADPTYDRQLKFTPRHLANITLSVNSGFVGFNIIHSIAGRRYTTDDNSASLDPYRLTQMNLVTNIPIGPSTLTARIEANNVFDRDYEVFPQYPMPKRNYRVTVGARF